MVQYNEEDSTSFIKDWYDNEEYDFLKYLPAEESNIREIAEKVLSEIKEIPKNEANYGVTHGDLWLENILVADNFKLSLIEFQDYAKNFFLYDLVVPIYSAMEFSFVGGGNIIDYGKEITQAIIEGYQEEHTEEQIRILNNYHLRLENNYSLFKM